LKREDLARLIPHQGRMCLLDGVIEYDDTSIVCISATHRSAENPLRSRGRLGAWCGLEYAAQAVAVHGGLLAASAAAQPGYLAGARDLRLAVERLDDIESDLILRAEQLFAGGQSLLYAFTVGADEKILLEGRLSVFFPANEPGPSRHPTSLARPLA
jgi:predicted hotdog family 3-hydroxylacyl-ACP dehydratase